MAVHHDPLGAFRDEVVFLLQEALHSLRQDEARERVRAQLGPAPAGKGDFAYPAFPLAKTMRKAPPAIAQEIAAALPSRPHVRVSVEGPYVNFALDPQAITAATLDSVRDRGLAFGTHPDTGLSTIVEHTSANPNGPFHVGRARNPIVGDTLARILRASGDSVTTEYYVNDMGKQVAILTWGLQNLKPGDVPPAERDKADHQRVAYYQKANEMQENDPQVAAAIGKLLQRFEEGDEQVATAFRESASLVLSGMRESLARLNVTMDRYSFESEYVLNGSVQDVVGKLKKSPLAHQDETGSWYLDLAEHGIHGRSSRWTFLRKDGTTLYTTRDLAYHLDKFQRADKAVNVLGEDHKLTMQQLEIALDVIGEERTPDVVWISFVALPEGKMSTRRNRVVFIDDLLDEAVARARDEVQKRRGADRAEAEGDGEGRARLSDLTDEEMDAIAELVGVGALRFNIARVQAEKSITFRWEEALNFEGDSAPFVQYAHARCASLLRKASADDLAPVWDDAAKHLTHESEHALVRAIAKLPGLVKVAAEERRIHFLAGYAVELANAFNAFYRDCPVLIAQEPVRSARLALVDATRQTLSNTLGLLGIEAPDAM